MKPRPRITPIVLASFSLAPIAALPVFAADPFQDVTDNVGLQGVGGGLRNTDPPGGERYRPWESERPDTALWIGHAR